MMKQAKVISITPKLLIKKEAMKYTGLERKTFDKVIAENGLSIYAYGRNKVWYKISELDELMESFLIKKSQRELAN
jgi:predicted DNA-binding transcriptional regulator AlpA